MQLILDGKGLVWNCIWVLKVRPQVAGLQEHAKIPGWWECHTQGRLYTTNGVELRPLGAGIEPQTHETEKAHLLRFNHLATHLCFKQAQPKICHSPKVDDGVDIFFKFSWKRIFGQFFFEEL